MTGAGGRHAVRAMLFDAGNTLLRMDYAAIAARLVALGVATTADAVQRAEWQARVRLDAGLGPAVSTESRATGDRYTGLILDALGVRDGAVLGALTAWRRDYNPPVGIWGGATPDAAAALDAARAAGLATAVISNSNGSVRGILQSLDLARRLDLVIDSFEVGVEKPDPRIFRLALDRLGVAADAAVYVGDLYTVDVLGARAAGLDGILLDPGGLWGPRDCPTAPSALAAVRLALDGGRARVSRGG